MGLNNWSARIRHRPLGLSWGIWLGPNCSHCFATCSLSKPFSTSLCKCPTISSTGFAYEFWSIFDCCLYYCPSKDGCTLNYEIKVQMKKGIHKMGAWFPLNCMPFGYSLGPKRSKPGGQ